MTLRDFLRSWLRGLRATRAVLADERAARTIDKASLRAYREREMAARQAAPDRWLTAEALWSLPAVEPDRSSYQRPDIDDTKALVIWMVYERSDAWWMVQAQTVRMAAVYWLAMREQITGVRIS